MPFVIDEQETWESYSSQRLGLLIYGANSNFGGVRGRWGSVRPGRSHVKVFPAHAGVDIAYTTKGLPNLGQNWY